MPKYSTTMSTLSGLIDSESDAYMSDPDITRSPDSAMENVAPPKKGHGRPKGSVSKVTKAKGSTRRASGASVVSVKRSAPLKKVVDNNARRRPALAEQINRRHESDTEEVEEFEDQEESAMADDLAASPVRAKQPAKRSKASAAKATKDPVERVKGKSSKSKEQSSMDRKNISSRLAGEKVVAETQMDVDISAVTVDYEEEQEPTPRPTARHTSRARSVSKSRQEPPRQASKTRKRTGSGSDAERSGAGADPVMRRKLGEMTKKLENLDLKYRNLREVGIKESEANLEKIKRSSADRINAAENLITSLKKDLALQTSLAKESKSLQRQLNSRDAEVGKLQSQLSEVSSALFSAQKENNALSAKLAANRTAASSVQSMDNRTPGSAIKSHGGIRTVMVGSAEAAQAAVVAKLKEELYSDLSGLIIPAVRKEEDANVYDCLQTGRNGSLHFKLSVANGQAKDDDYDLAEFIYMPQLDANRDKALMEILPDYLQEEITFARENAGRFYARVVDSLTRRRTEDD